MVQDISNWFKKGDTDENVHLPKDTSAKFTLKIEDLVIAYVDCTEGVWTFKYSEEFKKNLHTYRYITGFPDLDKTYTSTSLWPFFRIRIPGLGQPAIKEILAKENISNPYILIHE